MGSIKKNILIITSSHPSHGSGVVALDLYKGLKANSKNNVTLVTKTYGVFEDPNIISFSSYFTHQKTRVIRKLRKLFVNPFRSNPDFHFFQYDQTKSFRQISRLFNKIKMKPDVVIALFLTDFFSYKDLSEIRQKTGAKWILYPMDMEPFTGGCHYTWNCEGYLKACGNCPALYSTNAIDQSSKNLKFKETNLDNDVEVFAMNKQILGEIKKSKLMSNLKIHSDIFAVPDRTIFKAGNQKVLREKMGIPTDSLVFFIGSVSLVEKRKGISILKESLDLLKIKLSQLNTQEQHITLIVAGSEKGSLVFPFTTRYVGFLKKYEDLAEMYQVADFFLCPSLEDTGPTMVLQSYLCHTPIIAFKVGFSVEFGLDGYAGFIAAEKTAKEYALALERAVLAESAMRQKIKSNLEIIDNELNTPRVFERIQKVIDGN